MINNSSKVTLYRNKPFILILILFIACSYQKIISVDFLDDACFIIIGMYFFMGKIIRRKIKKIESYYYFIILFSFLSSLINNGIGDFFVFLKIVVTLLISYDIVFYSAKEKYMALKLSVICSIPNILCGINQYYITHIKHQYIMGKYDALLGFRISGYVGHPIHYSLLMIGILLFVLFYTKKKYLKIIDSFILVFLIKYTASDFSYALTIVFISIKMIVFLLKYVSRLRNFKKYILPIACLTMILGSVFLVYKMTQEITTIRYISTIGAIQETNFFTAFIGHGVGAFTHNGYQEAYLFRIYYDMGLLGLTLIIGLLINMIKQGIMQKDYCSVIVLVSLFLNLIINDGYMIPFIAMVPLFCARVQGFGDIKYEQKDERSSIP